MKVTFLGAGVFGEALSKIVEYNGNEVRFYDPYKYPKVSLTEATGGADIIIYTAPSNKHAEILPEIDKKTPLVCASKGFLSLKPFKEFRNFSALGGAAFAEQIAPEKTLNLTVSSETLEQLFSTETIKTEYTKDTLGIMLSGALKNVYAIGAGMFGDEENEEASEESENGETPKNSNQDYLMPYFTSVAGEMQEILEVNGAEKNTLKLSCGIPDLVLSCTEKSRNFRFGKALKYGEKPEETTIEGLSVIRDLKEYPEFIVPESATVLKNVIEEVEKYLKEEQNAAK